MELNVGVILISINGTKGRGKVSRVIGGKPKGDKIRLSDQVFRSRSGSDRARSSSVITIRSRTSKRAANCEPLLHVRFMNSKSICVRTRMEVTSRVSNAYIGANFSPGSSTSRFLLYNGPFPYVSFLSPLFFSLFLSYQEWHAYWVSRNYARPHHQHGWFYVWLRHCSDQRDPCNG